MNYGRDGKPMSSGAWSRLLDDDAYRIIKQEMLLNGRWLSTVWVGIDYNFGDDGPPLIFETMIFSGRGDNSLDQRRYATEEEAMAGHEEMKARWL